MRDRSVRMILAFLLVLLITLILAPFSPNDRSKPITESSATTIKSTPPAPEDNFDVFVYKINAYLDYLQKAEVAEALEAAAWSEAVEVELVSERSSVRTSTSTTSNISVSGECGGATNGADQYIGRESGGNANVYNTGGSGAWGCYQIMPGTWASSCSDLGQHGSADATIQAQCASRLPLSAWAG